MPDARASGVMVRKGTAVVITRLLLSWPITVVPWPKTGTATAVSNTKAEQERSAFMREKAGGKDR
jgi:hypothetical protein